MDNYIWIQRKRYYYHKTYNTGKEAKKWADHYRKQNGCRYFIIKAESQGFLDIVPEIKYRLYMNKLVKIW